MVPVEVELLLRNERHMYNLYLGLLRSHQHQMVPGLKFLTLEGHWVILGKFLSPAVNSNRGTDHCPLYFLSTDDHQDDAHFVKLRLTD